MAKEELGKAIIFEELIYRVGITKEWAQDSHTKDFVMKALTSHALKQQWFARHANDFLGGRSHGEKYRYPSPIFRELYSGKAEIKKQDSTYVGLTRAGDGKVDFDGRISLPWVRANEGHAYEEITVLNDFLVIYSDGYSRGIYATDSPDIAEYLTQDLVNSLQELWPNQGIETVRILKKLRKTPPVDNPWGWWQD